MSIFFIVWIKHEADSVMYKKKKNQKKKNPSPAAVNGAAFSKAKHGRVFFKNYFASSEVLL